MFSVHVLVCGRGHVPFIPVPVHVPLRVCVNVHVSIFIFMFMLMLLLCLPLISYLPLSLYPSPYRLDGVFLLCLPFISSLPLSLYSSPYGLDGPAKSHRVFLTWQSSRLAELHIAGIFSSPWLAQTPCKRICLGRCGLKHALVTLTPQSNIPCTTESVYCNCLADNSAHS